MKTVAERSLDMASLFEAEIFLQLLLWKWRHPYADDAEFRNGLLEDATVALQNAAAGTQLFEEVPAKSLNFIAAVWYVESASIELSNPDPATVEMRKSWLSSIRRTLPSCFCDPSDLNPS